MSAKFQNTDPFTGATYFLEIQGMTQPEFDAKILEWRNGELIQNVFPGLTPDQREFIMTGITPESWESLFKGEKED